MPAQFSQTIPNGPYRNISLPTQMPFAAYPLGHAIDSSVNSLIPLRNGQQRAHTQSHRRGASDSRHRRVPSAVEQPSAHRPWSQTLEHFREFRFRPWSLKASPYVVTECGNAYASHHTRLGCEGSYS